MRIACLHTVQSNVAVFDAAAADLPGVTLSHHLRADLLQRAEAEGGLTDAIRDEAADLLRALAQDADAVLLTCSTVGPAAERADLLAPVPVLRVDGALASAAIAAAAAGKRRVVVLCTVQTTVEPTRELFERRADGTEVAIDVRVAPGAWEAFRAGDAEAYNRLIAKAADAIYAEGEEVIAFAQASMAGAAALCTRGTPLTSPAAGLAAAARS
ncbi:MAG: Asp/Glu racemase [Acetobacteraceae bacterium]|nr:Asp/Glu racemase [Acetobacteraceae bacterium]